MEIFEWYKRIIRGRRAVVFEFGCNDGYHSLKLTHLADTLCPEYTYVALEPDPRAFVHARAALQGNPSVTLIEAAVHRLGGAQPFYLSSGVGEDGTVYSGSSSLLKPAAVTEVWPHMRFDATTMVQCYTYDELFHSMAPGGVDFIWADIQGSEIDLIRGGRAALQKTRYVYMEYSNGGLYHGDASLEALCRALGDAWEIAEDFGGDVLVRNREVPAE
jgi:FkbM family methyltransferase